MYGKEQASKIRQQFWTNLGQYLKPVPGAGFEQPNWINYKTGIRHIYFKMDAGKSAYISIEIRTPDEAMRTTYYEQLCQLKSILEQHSSNEWIWEPEVLSEHGQVYSRIYQQLEGVNIMNQSDWPAIIAFLKPRIIGLDAFWELVKDGFDV